MERLLLSAILVAAFAVFCSCSGGDQERKVHIVYLGEKPQGDFRASHEHTGMLQRILGSAFLAKNSLVYSYGKSFNGFAARLTDEEASKISGMEAVVSVYKSKKIKPHTTRSWDFMGFSEGKVGASQESDVVIGLLDTGIWPESESFNDEGMRPPPAKWKGICQGVNFTCNNKLIGARYYNADNDFDPTEFKSPRDSEGHGTHTSSTAAGREVKGASYFGLAEGTAKGGVPGARIAVYKVCWSAGCSDVDILAAFDDAISDGVDILSVSLGGFASFYFEDSIAVGSFHAMKNGILTSNSAGNDGPFPLSVANVAPWTLTVAASTIDRRFVSRVVLGNGQVYNGLSINSFDLHGASFPLIWGGDAGNISAGVTSDISRECFGGDLNADKVKGKIVFCESSDDGSSILLTNGVGAIMADSSIVDVSFSYPLPATLISNEDGLKVLEYIKNTDYPVATILFGETPTDVMAPYVIFFSSRGPNTVSPDILKPDISAPGVDILAAWSPVAGPSIYDADTRSVPYNVLSGTSMACPHASATAANVKAAHPDWSPAAIKSAIMTTAFVMDSNKHEDLEFAYGSGHINPLNATDPGLVYDASELDYINFLCKDGYNTTTVRLITGDNSSACNGVLPGRGWDLNYPSFSVAVEDGQKIFAVFTRVVTNVGSPNSTYNARTYMPSFLSVTVEPSVLFFGTVGEKQRFTVKVSGPKISQQAIASGAILWEDGVHVVRSPLVVYTIIPGGFDIFAEKKVRNSKGSLFPRSNGFLGHI